MQTNRSAFTRSGTVMEAADDLLAKAEEFDALRRAEDDGMIARERRIAGAMENYTERPLFPAREGS